VLAGGEEKKTQKRMKREKNFSAKNTKQEAEPMRNRRKKRGGRPEKGIGERKKRGLGGLLTPIKTGRQLLRVF